MSASKLDLATAIFDKIEEVGVDAAAKFFGKTATTIKKWQGGTVQPDVSAAQRILDEAITGGFNLPVFDKPPKQGDTIPEAAPVMQQGARTTETDGNDSTKLTPVEPQKLVKAAKKFAILTPINRDMPFVVTLSMLGNWKATLPVEIRSMLGTVDFEHDTLIHRARNILATRFMDSGSEWSFWMDSDIVAPIGNPGWFKRRTGTKHDDKWFSYSAIERLSSRNKTLIGGVYAERNTSGRLIVQPGISPKDEGDKKIAEQIKMNGPEDRVIQVGWLGFGCVIVHRRVFEDILAKDPEGVKRKNEREPYNFFNAIDGGPQGEDVAFCQRAAKAGHPSFLDLSVWCGHIGKFAFMP